MGANDLVTFTLADLDLGPLLCELEYLLRGRVVDRSDDLTKMERDDDSDELIGHVLGVSDLGPDPDHVVVQVQFAQIEREYTHLVIRESAENVVELWDQPRELLLRHPAIIVVPALMSRWKVAVGNWSDHLHVQHEAAAVELVPPGPKAVHGIIFLLTGEVP